MGMERTQREQEYLREIYARANVLEYDRLEEEKVRRNQKALVRRSVWKGAVALFIAGGGLGVAWKLGFEGGACAAGSLLAVGLGIALESAELRWNASEGMKSLNTDIGRGDRR